MGAPGGGCGGGVTAPSTRRPAMLHAPLRALALDFSRRADALAGYQWGHQRRTKQVPTQPLQPR